MKADEALKTAKHHKIGFYLCSLTYTFERTAFYTVKYMIAIFIATAVSGGGLGLKDSQGASMVAIFVAFTYIMPIIGGYVADYWISPRILVPVGLFIMGLGYCSAWFAHSLPMIWVMIILVSIGTGCFKGNLAGIGGLLVDDKKRLDQAFSTQYSFVNAGVFIGMTFVVLLIPLTSFRFVFLLMGLLLFFDAIWFVASGRYIGDAGKQTFKHDQRDFDDQAASANKEKTSEKRSLTSTEKKQIIAIILIVLFSVVFWMAWYMVYMPVYYYFGYGNGSSFIHRANWFIGNFHVPTSYMDSLNSILDIALGPILGLLWTRLAQRPQGDISMFKKTALSLIFMGLCYGTMVVADVVGKGNASLIWIVLVAVFMSVGEMMFSPLGNSFITKLAPARYLGLFLGVWPLAVFFANLLYPPLYNILRTSNPARFQLGYGILAIVIFALGAILWVTSKFFDTLEKQEPTES